MKQLNYSVVVLKYESSQTVNWCGTENMNTNTQYTLDLLAKYDLHKGRCLAVLKAFKMN